MNEYALTALIMFFVVLGFALGMSVVVSSPPSRENEDEHSRTDKNGRNAWPSKITERPPAPKSHRPTPAKPTTGGKPPKPQR